MAEKEKPKPPATPEQRSAAMSEAIRQRDAKTHQGLMDRHVALRDDGGKGKRFNDAITERGASIHRGLMDRAVALGDRAPDVGPKAKPSTSPAVSGSTSSKPADSGPKRPTGLVIGPTGRIEQAPAFLAPLAGQINKLSDQRKNTKGQNGIKVLNSAGNTIISIDPTQAGDLDVSELHYNDGTISIDIDGSGIVLTNIASGDYAKFYTTGAIGLVDAGTGNEFLIAPSDLANGDIIPREMIVAENGVPKRQDFLAGPTRSL